MRLVQCSAIKSQDCCRLSILLSISHACIPRDVGGFVLFAWYYIIHNIILYFGIFLDFHVQGRLLSYINNNTYYNYIIYYVMSQRSECHRCNYMLWSKYRWTLVTLKFASCSRVGKASIPPPPYSEAIVYRWRDINNSGLAPLAGPAYIFLGKTFPLAALYTVIGVYIVRFYI